MVGRKARALYACKAEHDSELSFIAGTVFENGESGSERASRKEKGGKMWAGVFLQFLFKGKGWPWEIAGLYLALVMVLVSFARRNSKCCSTQTETIFIIKFTGVRLFPPQLFSFDMCLWVAHIFIDCCCFWLPINVLFMYPVDLALACTCTHMSIQSAHQQRNASTMCTCLGATYSFWCFFPSSQFMPPGSRVGWKGLWTDGQDWYQKTTWSFCSQRPQRGPETARIYKVNSVLDWSIFDELTLVLTTMWF